MPRPLKYPFDQSQPFQMIRGGRDLPGKARKFAERHGLAVTVELQDEPDEVRQQCGGNLYRVEFSEGDSHE